MFTQSFLLQIQTSYIRMKNLSLLFSCLLCVACSQTPQIEHDFVEPTVIYNDIESRMPGSLMILNHYAIWSDPLSPPIIAYLPTIM